MSANASSAAPAEIELREVATSSELRACQALQRRTWGITEDGYVMPVSTMAAARKFGGLVLGAFAGPRLVGFTFAFLGRLEDGELTLYSQLAAIDVEHQGTGLGKRLKLEQRRRAGELGLASVSWTFDPLQARNAAFNLGSLGARSHRYEVDLYGPRADALHHGQATDRLVMRWPTEGPVGGRTTPFSNATELILTDEQGLVADVRAPSGDQLHLATPGALADLKSHGREAVAHWQSAVRQSFQAAFAAGYEAVGFVRGGGREGRYLLQRRG